MSEERKTLSLNDINASKKHRAGNKNLIFGIIEVIACLILLIFFAGYCCRELGQRSNASMATVEQVEYIGKNISVSARRISISNKYKYELSFEDDGELRKVYANATRLTNNPKAVGEEIKILYADNIKDGDQVILSTDVSLYISFILFIVSFMACGIMYVIDGLKTKDGKGLRDKIFLLPILVIAGSGIWLIINLI